MTNDENHKNERQPLEANVYDEIKIVSDITVAASDITVAFRGPGGDEQQHVFDEGCPSDMIAKSVCEDLNVPAEDPYKGWLEGRIEVTREEIREQGWKCTAEIPIPTGWLKYLGLPEEIPIKLEISGGEKKRVTKHTIIRKQGPS